MRRLLTVSCLSAAFMLGGCQQWNDMWKSDKKKEDRVSMTSIPAAVRSAFEKEFPGATVSRVEQEKYDNGDVHYEITLKDQSGRMQKVEYQPDGKRAHQ